MGILQYAPSLSKSMQICGSRTLAQRDNTFQLVRDVKLFEFHGLGLPVDKCFSSLRAIKRAGRELRPVALPTS